MSVDLDAIVRVIAYGVPAPLILIGGVLLLLGYPINHSGMIRGGWTLILIGVVVYVGEMALKFLLVAQEQQSF